ncbi:hypothetical protein Tco_1319643 [Tanacetum coccineum]
MSTSLESFIVSTKVKEPLNVGNSINFDMEDSSIHVRSIVEDLDFQDSPDDEEDTRSSQEYMDDLKEDYQARSLLAKSKSSSQHKPELRPTKDIEAKYNKVKAKLAFLCSSAPAFKSSMVKNKGLIAEAYEWDKEEMSSDDNEMVEVKVLMVLANDNVVVTKEGARNGKWVKISMRKVNTLLEMKDNDERKNFPNYLCIDLNYVEEQRNNLLSKHRDLVQELNTCKEQILVLKQAKLDFLTMHQVNTGILKENQNLIKELKELTAITETWLNSSNKVNQCISEQFPTQKKRILGVDQLIKDPSSSGQKDLAFVKSSSDDTKVSIPVVERPWLYEAKGFILPNHDTGRILPAESQVNTTDPLVAVTDSLVTDYDPADESSVCSTPLPLLEKLAGADAVSGPKTIKSILKSNYTFKVEALKGVTINEPSSAPAKANYKASTLKTNSVPAVHTTTDHNDIEWFRRGEALQDKKAEAHKSNKTELSNASISKTPTKSGCSCHMTGVKSYLHKYMEQPGPKLVFGDDSTCTTEGYGSIKCAFGLAAKQPWCVWLRVLAPRGAIVLSESTEGALVLDSLS